MSDAQEPILPPQGQFLVYRAEDGRVQIDVRLENETVWLTQQHMADLFQTTKQNVSLHLQNIFKEGELSEISVVKDSLTTATDGKSYTKKFYNLDAIISVGYRVKSAVATRFRIWATQKLREFRLCRGPGHAPGGSHAHAGLDHQAEWFFDVERTRHPESRGENLAPDGQGTGRGGIRDVFPPANCTNRPSWR